MTSDVLSFILWWRLPWLQHLEHLGQPQIFSQNQVIQESQWLPGLHQTWTSTSWAASITLIPLATLAISITSTTSSHPTTSVTSATVTNLTTSITSKISINLNNFRHFNNFSNNSNFYFRSYMICKQLDLEERAAFEKEGDERTNWVTWSLLDQSKKLISQKADYVLP